MQITVRWIFIGLILMGSFSSVSAQNTVKDLSAKASAELRLLTAF